MFIPLTPLRFLSRARELWGQKIGIISGEQQFTYRQFAERAERLADALVEIGIQPGDRVAYLSFNTHQLLEGYYGVVQARAIVMPLNVRLSPPEILKILQHATPRMVLFEEDFAPLLHELKSHCPFVEHWVVIGPAYEELLA